ncbi:MAG: response regulator transcription factor [Oscillospiraceae bacterium]|nr:response regulator transcription factor [Oscillospiraceae bacterium]
MEKIFILEDDEVIKNELRKLLISNGYAVVEKSPFDLALLDVNVPGESGYEVCRKIRSESDVPVIFLTAMDTVENEILGFGVGADDYIRKPYNSSVLLARIARLLRRKSSALKCGEMSLDTEEMKVYYGEKSTELTKNEVKILACLMKKSLCTREEIIETLWNDSVYIDDNTLSVNISRLREKLKSVGATGSIRTVRGVGYRL